MVFCFGLSPKWTVSNQLISLASREQSQSTIQARLRASQVSNQLISLASRERYKILVLELQTPLRFQSINFPSE